MMNLQDASLWKNNDEVKVTGIDNETFCDLERVFRHFSPPAADATPKNDGAAKKPCETAEL
jgi:hypothetical protein